MLKKEIIGILKDKRTFLIILLVLIIPIIDLSVEYKQMNVAYMVFLMTNRKPKSFWKYL